MEAWKKERSVEKPAELQKISRDDYIERKNIRQVEVDDADGTKRTEYECDSRIIPESEYMMLQSIREIDSAKAIDAYTEQLIEEGIL